MVAGHLISLRNVMSIKNRSLLLCCPSKFIRRYFPQRSIHHQPHHRRYASSDSSSTKKTVPLVIALSLAGGGIAAWYLGKKSSPEQKIESPEPEEDPPYVYEHLQEDLALLSEFGPVPYLLVGAGTASFTAYRAIRTRDPTAKVLMIGQEPFLPYMRPPLSKEVWFDKNADVAKTLAFSQWNGRSRSLFYEPEEYFFSLGDLLENKNGGISIIRGKKVVKVDPSSQAVYLDSGEKISYQKCLLATGSKPKNLPQFEDPSLKKHVTLYKTIRDFQKLEAISQKVKSIAVIGGGLLGSELAVGLAHRVPDLEVTLAFPETGIMGKILPEYLSKWTTDKLINEGVKVAPGSEVKSVVKDGDKVIIEFNDNRVLKVDHVVVAAGAEPDTAIAKPSGLEVDEKRGGFLVNTEMEARKNLWVAGDAACFYDATLGRRRVEHHDQAIVTGRLAGENMTGNAKPYWHQSMFWSDLGPTIGFEAIGVVDASLPTIGVFAKSVPESEMLPEISLDGGITDPALSTERKEPASTSDSGENYSKGVLFYLRDNIIVGIVLWNVFSKMSVARQIINESKSYEDITEVAKLFELYSAPEEV